MPHGNYREKGGCTLQPFNSIRWRFRETQGQYVSPICLLIQYSPFSPFFLTDFYFLCATNLVFFLWIYSMGFKRTAISSVERHSKYFITFSARTTTWCSNHFNYHREHEWIVFIAKYEKNAHSIMKSMSCIFNYSSTVYNFI